MIIPVRCFGCGKVLADKWDGYVRLCEGSDASPIPGVAPATPASQASQRQPTTAPQRRQMTAAERLRGGGADAAAAAADAPEEMRRTAQGKALDALGVVDMCCRTAMLTHVDLSHVI